MLATVEQWTNQNLALLILGLIARRARRGAYEGTKVSLSPITSTK